MGCVDQRNQALLCRVFRACIICLEQNVQILVYNDPSWNYSQYDFKNFLKETAYAAAFLNATNTDYTSFKKLNGKMIMYHGWNDPALSALSTIGIMKRQ
jgi:hypothetical protein